VKKKSKLKKKIVEEKKKLKKELLCTLIMTKGEGEPKFDLKLFMMEFLKNLYAFNAGLDNLIFHSKSRSPRQHKYGKEKRE